LFYCEEVDGSNSGGKSTGGFSGSVLVSSFVLLSSSVFVFSSSFGVFSSGALILVFPFFLTYMFISLI
jgi:hypothetical protein